MGHGTGIQGKATWKKSGPAERKGGVGGGGERADQRPPKKKKATQAGERSQSGGSWKACDEVGQRKVIEQKSDRRCFTKKLQANTKRAA